MKIELAYISNQFVEYELCTDRKIVEQMGPVWYFYIKGEAGIPNLVCPANIPQIRYDGFIFYPLFDTEHLAMLKKKLETDIALAQLE